jgi:hypothetical protein
MEKDLHEYAWNWFEYHAGQRLTAFHFFLIFLGALVVGFSTGIKDGNLFFAQAVAYFGAFVSFAFFMLEIRNEQLVDIGRNALAHLEGSLMSRPELQLICLARKNKPKGKHRPDFVSHKFWLRAIYLACTFLFIIGAVSPTIMRIVP